MLKIPISLHQNLQTALLKCGPFDSNENLRASFAVAPLVAWQAQLPQTRTEQERIQATIDLLAQQETADGQNPLVIFLQYLSENKDPRDSCHQELAALAHEVSQLPQIATHAPPVDDFDSSQPPARELIGRKAELEQLRQLHQQFITQKHGQFIFILSRPGYGRQALVNTWANEVKPQPHTTVLHLNFATQPPAPTQEWPHTTEILGGFWLELVAQLSQALGYPVRPGDGLTDTPEVMVKLLRRLTQAKRQKVVLLLETFDRAPSAWLEIINYLSKEIVKDLPVLAVMTLTAKQPLAQLAKADFNETLHFAKSVAPRHNNHIWLDRLTPADIASYTGALEPTLLEPLCHLSNGVSAWVEDLWHDWQAEATIYRSADGTWHAHDEILSDIRLYLKQRLTPRLAEQSEFTFQQVEDILGYANLEGVTFTAQVIAQVLQMDADTFMDFVDDYLLDNEEELGVYQEVGFVQWPRELRPNLYQYRFSRPYLWHLAQRYLADESQRLRMAEALESHYGQAADLELSEGQAKYALAETIIRLFTATGQPQRAEPYRAMLRRRDATENIKVMQWQEQFLSQFVESDFERYRLYDLRLDLIEKLKDTGHYHEALPYAQAALTQAEQWHNELWQAKCLRWMGRLLRLVGEYKAALPYFKRALTIDEKILGANHPDTANSLNSLGVLFSVMGDYAAARSYHERALAIMEKGLGAEHPHTASSMGNLGQLLQKTGDYAAAHPYHERALAIREKVLGTEHPDTATSLNNLGQLLRSMGDYATARLYYERALAIREKGLGAEHPDTATSLNNLGGLCYDEGNLVKAAEYMRRAVAIYDKVLGPQHPYTQGARRGLADIEGALAGGTGLPE